MSANASCVERGGYSADNQFCGEIETLIILNKSNIIKHLFCHKRKNSYICRKYKNMAISIKTIPVLTGETASRFVLEAEVNSANSRPSLSETMEKAISNMLETSRKFKFQ